MFVDQPLDTLLTLWTSRGLLPRSGLVFSTGESRGRGHVIHHREWRSGSEVVRRDVWVEVTEPLLGTLHENQGVPHHG